MQSKWKCRKPGTAKRFRPWSHSSTRELSFWCHWWGRRRTSRYARGRPPRAAFALPLLRPHVLGCWIWDACGPPETISARKSSAYCILSHITAFKGLSLLAHLKRVGVPKKGLTCEGTCWGGSIRMLGSHSPGGKTVTASRNSSIPANKCSRFRALYATSWKTSSLMMVATARPISW